MNYLCSDRILNKSNHNVYRRCVDYLCSDGILDKSNYNNVTIQIYSSL